MRKIDNPQLRNSATPQSRLDEALAGLPQDIAEQLSFSHRVALRFMRDGLDNLETVLNHLRQHERQMLALLDPPLACADRTTSPGPVEAGKPAVPAPTANEAPAAAGNAHFTDRERKRVAVIQALIENRTTPALAAHDLGMELRRLHALRRAYEEHGPAGLVSRRRGKPSNRALPIELRRRAIHLIRQNSTGCGPTRAARYLALSHAITISVATLATWMQAEGLWRGRKGQGAMPANERAVAA